MVIAFISVLSQHVGTTKREFANKKKMQKNGKNQSKNRDVLCDMIYAAVNGNKNYANYSTFQMNTELNLNLHKSGVFLLPK